MSQSERKKHGTSYYRAMTVAQVRRPEGVRDAEIVFLESARFYKLLETSPSFEKMLRLLRNGMAKGRPLKVRCASVDSDVIEEVQE